MISQSQATDMINIISCLVNKLGGNVTVTQEDLDAILNKRAVFSYLNADGKEEFSIRMVDISKVDSQSQLRS